LGGPGQPAGYRHAGAWQGVSTAYLHRDADAIAIAKTIAVRIGVPANRPRTWPDDNINPLDAVQPRAWDLRLS
ncbi:MAG: hypothetical protein ACK4F7_03535, partial [Inhella sp.]